MLRFEWNALRVGDRVVVHDDAGTLSFAEGAVSVVHRRSVGGRDVGIRVDGTPWPVFPRRHAVHLLPWDASEPCWRCDSGRSAPASLGSEP